VEGRQGYDMKMRLNVKNIVLGLLIAALGTALGEMMYEKFKKAKVESPNINASPGGRINSPSVSQHIENNINSPKYTATNMTIIQLPPLSRADRLPGEKKTADTQNPKIAFERSTRIEKKTTAAPGSDLEAVQDKNNQIIWQKNIETNVLTWTAAQEYCKNLGLGGYDDWRLPTISELESLVDKRYSPPINPLFGTLPVSYLPYFWSSTIEPNDHKEAQFLNFKNGLPAHINKETGYGFARCVRHG